MTPALLRECGASCEGTYFIQKRRDLCEIYGERPGELLSALLFKIEADGSGGTKPMRVREDHVQQWMLTESALKTIRNWLAHLADCGVLKIRRGQSQIRFLSIDLGVLREDIANWRAGSLFSKNPIRSIDRIETPAEAVDSVNLQNGFGPLTESDSVNLPNLYIGSKNGLKNSFKEPVPEPEPEPEPAKPEPAKTQTLPGKTKTQIAVEELTAEYSNALEDYPDEATIRNLSTAIETLKTEELRAEAVGRIRADLDRARRELTQPPRKRRFITRWGGIVQRCRYFASGQAEKMAGSRAPDSAGANGAPAPEESRGVGSSVAQLARQAGISIDDWYRQQETMFGGGANVRIPPKTETKGAATAAAHAAAG